MNILNYFRHRRPGEPAVDDYPSNINIYIDNEHYQIGDISLFRLSGRVLRVVGGVDDTRDLWIDIPGLQDDVLVQEDDVVTLHAGMRFFSTPRTVNKG